MCEKMEDLVIEPRPLDASGGWDQQVNGKARRLDESREMEHKYWAKEAARRKAERRIRRIMNAIAFALALVIVGGVYLNYVEGFPIWIAASVTVTGIALLFFVIGWLFGRRSR